MPKSPTPSFITEIPLVVDSNQEKELLACFQAGRQLYNACLSEAVARMNLVRGSKVYEQAKKLPKGKARNNAFSEARKHYRYSDYDLQSYANLIAKRSCWIAQKIDAQTQQKLATRAFNASEKVLLGRAKKVRFKVASRFHSVEGKTNKQGIKWRNNLVFWGNLKLRPIINPKNPVLKHGLNSLIKYLRLLWRELNGKRRWYVQLVNAGVAYQKPQNYISCGLVGIDLNISNIAFVADNKAGLLPFAKGVTSFQAEIKQLQRKLERSRRINNQNNYHPDFLLRKGRKSVKKKGKPIKGKQSWKNSGAYYQIAARKREIERRKANYAKSQNRRLVNEILRHGNKIQAENVSVKGWQKRYGKAIAAKSPGFVQSELKRKAENANGSFQKFSTRSTALSQTHLNGERLKKTLSERVHRDVTGVVMHRDLFSAFLSRHVNQDKLSLQDAQIEYQRLESVLMEAWQRYCQQLANKIGSSEILRSDSSAEQVSIELEKFDQISQLELKVKSRF